MSTATLTNAQLNAAATATLTIAQPPKPTSPWTGCKVHFYVADAAADPAFAGKAVADVDVGDGGPMVTIAYDDVNTLAPAEASGLLTVLKRFVVEARARKGAA